MPVVAQRAWEDPELTEAESKKVISYVDHLLESGEGEWDEFRCATPEETAGKSVADLKEMLVRRGLTVRGRKAELVERLHTAAPERVWIRYRWVQNAIRLVAKHIDRYGDDGFGEKPEGMCRAEYWLAHLEPKWIRE
jgi:hypothetical protein